MKAKGFKVVIEELKQRISAKSEKLRCYCARDNQYRQKKTFSMQPKGIASRVRWKSNTCASFI